MTRSLLHEKINTLSLILISFTLPFHVLLCSYSIALFVINQILEGNLWTKLKAASSNKFVLVSLGFFGLHIAGLVYTANLHNGLFELEKKVSLLILPVFLYAATIKTEQVIKILLSFVAACFLLTVILLASATYNYILTGNEESFILDHLTRATGIHRVYASMYLLFSVYIIVYIRLKGFVKFKFSNSVFSILIAYFIVIIFLLSSRIVVGLTLVSFIVITIYQMRKTKRILGGSLILGAFIIFAASFFLTNEKVRTIMVQTYQDLDKGNSEANFTGPNLRIEIWKAAFQVAQENLAGVGTGDSNDQLYEQYVANDFKWGMQFRFNAHNQYLQTLVELGVVGLGILLFWLIWPALFSFKKQQYLYLGFVLLFLATCLTESMLATQKGIVFYSFFNALLAFHYPKKNI